MRTPGDAKMQLNAVIRNWGQVLKITRHKKHTSHALKVSDRQTSV
jgi:hypothetical protein